LSARIHSRYGRRLADLPAHGGAIRIDLVARRFFCDSAGCPRRIFTERLPQLVAPHARTTTRLHGTHRDIGLALGGEAGSRLSTRLSMPTSPYTLLRRVREAPVPGRSKVRVLGVDDWALRKGHRYGMILCDLERGRPIDLLPERSADALCAWLKDHPEVEIISRDRGDEMIRGATAGAPQATQVADRWHLMRNLRDALVGTVDRHRPEVRQAAQDAAAGQPIGPADDSKPPPAPDSIPQSAGPESSVAGSASRARRLELYEQTLALHRQGLSVRAIVDRLKIHKDTVRGFLAADTFPERAERAYERGTDPHVEHLKRRWSEGCRNAAVLFQELRALGFIGSYYMVRRQLAVWRKAEPPASTQPTGSPSGLPIGKLSSRRVTSLLLKEPTDHEPEERAFVETLTAGCPELKAAVETARTFTNQESPRPRQFDSPLSTRSY
jgi:transposase